MTRTGVTLHWLVRTQQQAGVRVSGHWTGAAVLISLRLWHYAVRRAQWAFLPVYFSPPLVRLPSPSPHPRLPVRCMIGLPQGTWVRGSHGRCARRATSIRRRRRRCSMWAAHVQDVRSWTISYDIWPPRYRTLDESAIGIAISCNRYDHYSSLTFLQAGRSSWWSTNSVKALKAIQTWTYYPVPNQR